ncbi:cytochrome b/b6 domain-containing protein [Ferruginivarius sediminum]|uniref:Cytochrome B n=1 Tax=Ferruginivarius sediminum TaxID=2661937 RepID=A0A369TIR8_9PROT|nr:cytochrome b/b6 domain-containing protein [Ferruginivarius sediminum]RDD62776.1 cytochrome B [Ferruginivarius sediminum]
MATADVGPRADTAAAGSVKVWDPLVRVLHWSLAGCFALAYVTGEEILSLHQVAGYGIVAIVGARALWGLVGPRYARFDDFVPGPGRLIGYLRDLLAGRPRRYLGHNPAGGAMIVALLAGLLGTGASGILTLYGGDAFEELHEVAANITLTLVLLHIAGVILSSLLHHENLVRAMITGFKRV